MEDAGEGEGKGEGEGEGEGEEGGEEGGGSRWRMQRKTGSQWMPDSWLWPLVRSDSPMGRGEEVGRGGLGPGKLDRAGDWRSGQVR